MALTPVMLSVANKPIMLSGLALCRVGHIQVLNSGRVTRMCLSNPKKNFLRTNSLAYFVLPPLTKEKVL
jgi:hypothetical protein